jgi:hypothetical protein
VNPADLSPTRDIAVCPSVPTSRLSTDRESVRVDVTCPAYWRVERRALRGRYPRRADAESSTLTRPSRVMLTFSGVNAAKDGSQSYPKLPSADIADRSPQGSGHASESTLLVNRLQQPVFG